MGLQEKRDDEIARMLERMSTVQQLVLRGELDTETVARGLQRMIDRESVSSCAPPPYFTSFIHQIHNVERWNEERGWGFTEEQVARCCLEARTFDWPGDRLQAIVLVPSLGSPGETFTELVEIATRSSRLHNAASEHARCEAQGRTVQLVDGIAFVPNTLRWRLVDLGSHARPSALASSDSPSVPSAWDYVTPETAAHAEALAAAAHFPDWLTSIRKKKAPAVVIPGYRLVVPGELDQFPSMSFGAGDIVTTLKAGGDAVWRNWAVATAGPVPLGAGL